MNKMGNFSIKRSLSKGVTLLSLAFCVFIFGGCSSNSNHEELAGPNGKITSNLYTSEDGSLTYDIQFKGATIVEPSALGITVDGVDLGRGVNLGSPVKTTVNESYKTRGVHSKAKNHYNQWEFPMTHVESGRQYSLEIRLYDDGVAYRYIVPGEGVQHVDGESSSWKIMPGAKTWYFERIGNQGWKLKSYAGEWISTDIENLENASPPHIGPVQGTPLVFGLPKDLGYAVVTKAALYNYSGIRLEAKGNRTIVANFTEGEKGFDVEGTIVTPWRTTMLSEDLNGLVNSDLIKNLNPAPDPKLFADMGYIKPGRSLWRFHSQDTGNPEEEKEFIDYAHVFGFEYNLIDAGWNEKEQPGRSLKPDGYWPKKWNDSRKNLKELCEHAKTKNVGVWVWSDSKWLNNQEDNYSEMRSFFDWIKEAGAVGVKIDFINSESKVSVDFEIAALRLAAERQLLVNFHGCHASTGEERTYPNELTRKGVRGLELNKHKGVGIPAWHNAALPFTRFLLGHADYTPLAYSTPAETTWAHQLSTAVLFVSALQVYCEHPDILLNDPTAKQALLVFKEIPASWDETIVLPESDIGKMAGMARRTNDKWFVAILNGDAEQKSYDLNLSFLPDGNYEAVLVEDDLNADPVDITKMPSRLKTEEFLTAIPFKVTHRAVDNSEKLELGLAPNGGFVAMITKIDQNF